MPVAEEEGRAPAVGSVVAQRYEIVADLGPCVTRHIYRAYDREVEVEVTLWWAWDALFAEALDRELFVDNLREVRKVKHTHILKVFDFGHVQDRQGTYIILQLGSSSPFEALLQSDEAVEGSVLLRYARALAAGIEAAYEQGHYHSWLSPADVVEVGGQIKVAGIGVFGGVDTDRLLSSAEDAGRYTAPEILEGREGSPASDWYSLSSLLLELASGQGQRDEGGMPEGLDSEKWCALTAALVNDPNERPTTAAEFLLPIERAWGAEDTEAVAPTATPKKKAVMETRNDEIDSETTLDDHIGGRNLLSEDEDGSRSSYGAGVEETDDPFVSEVVVPQDSELPGLRDTEGPEGARVTPAPPMLGEEGESSVDLHGNDEEIDTVISAEPTFQDADTDQDSDTGPSRTKERKSQVPGESRGESELFLGFQERSRRSRFIPLAFVVLVVAGAAYLLSFSKTNPSAKADPEEATVPDAAIPHSDATTATSDDAACPENMVHFPKQSLCIDAYEYPGARQTPRTAISLADARSQCGLRNARLCRVKEWERACRNKGTQSFSYGNRYRAEICNAESEELAPAGSSANCQNRAAVFDMNGNVAEWVEEGQIRGGSAFDGSESRCSTSRVPSDSEVAQFSDVGFRCCLDANTVDGSSEE